MQTSAKCFDHLHPFYQEEGKFQMATNDSTPRTIEIQMTKGYVAIVDEQDADLQSVKWFPNINKRNVYSRCNPAPNKGVTYSYMHRVIMARILQKPLSRNEQVDHIDGNGLNNSRNNLRIANNMENQRNRKSVKDSTSIYKGVSFSKRVNAWRSTIKYDGKPHDLGCYRTQEEAATIYNFVAQHVFGEFARLNDIPNWQSKVDCIEKKPRNSNTSGFIGVNKRGGNKWRAIAKVNGKKISLGSYDNPESAYQARKTFLEKLK